MQQNQAPQNQASIIRQAIAFDELEPLESLENPVVQDIRIEDMNIAAAIQSFKVFDWLLNARGVNESEAIFLLAEHTDDIAIADEIFTRLIGKAPLSPNSISLASDMRENEVANYLKAKFGM